jgi:hypothetical protein
MKRDLVCGNLSILVEETLIEGRKWFKKEAVDTVRVSTTQPMPELG